MYSYICVCINVAAPIIGDFYRTLLERDLAAFVANCQAATLLCFTLSVVTSTGTFLSDVLAVRWRAQLTHFLHRRYLHPGRRAFCWLASDEEDDPPLNKTSGGTAAAAFGSGTSNRHAELMNKSPALLGRQAVVDNPDQRIAADAKLLCDMLADTVQKIISAPFMIGINALLALRAVGWIAPVAISVYFVLALLINHVLATAVSARVTSHQRLEGDLRARHRWLCSRALDVGLSGGARAAELMVEDGLELALGMQLRVALRRWALNTAAEMQMQISSIINYGAVAVAVFAAANSGWTWGVSTGMEDLDGPHLAAAISRASFYTFAICQGWSDLVGASVQFGDIRGYAWRVRQLLQRISSLNPAACPTAPRQRPPGPQSSLGTDTHPAGMVVRARAAALPPGPLSRSSAVGLGGEGDAVGAGLKEVGEGTRARTRIVFSDLCVWSPLGQVLLDKLSLTVSHGEPLLITGPNGCGKSTLVSVIGGLCPHFTGTVTLPASARDMSIVPQRPVLAPGSLADLVRYPQPATLHTPRARACSSLRHDVLWQRLIAGAAALPGFTTRFTTHKKCPVCSLLRFFLLWGGYD